MKGRAFAAVVLSALLLLSGLGIGGWWLLWQRGPLQLAHHPLTLPRAARFVPASASFSLYLFSDGQRPVDYARAVAPARQRRSAGDAIARLRDGAFAAAGLDYEDELAGWLGGDLAMALFEDPVAAAGAGGGEQASQGWLLALASRDDDGARRFLQRFWQTRSLAGTDLQVSRYRGMGLISGRGALIGSRPEPLATALVDDDLVLIASGRNLLERALDVSQIPELNQAGQPLLRQGVAAFGSGAALAVASPQALQSWLGLPADAFAGSPAAPLSLSDAAMASRRLPRMAALAADLPDRPAAAAPSPPTPQPQPSGPEAGPSPSPGSPAAVDPARTSAPATAAPGERTEGDGAAAPEITPPARSPLPPALTRAAEPGDSLESAPAPSPSPQTAAAVPGPAAAPLTLPGSGASSGQPATEPAPGPERGAAASAGVPAAPAPAPPAAAPPTAPLPSTPPRVASPPPPAAARPKPAQLPQAPARLNPAAAPALLAVLQPQGRQLELRARLLLPGAPPLQPVQPDLAEALLDSLRGSPASLALIQDPAAVGREPLLRPLLERSLGLRPQLLAERQGPLPALLARSIHGPLLVSQAPEGWQLASRAGDPAAADLEPLLSQTGLLEAPLAFEGHSLRVWTQLSPPGRSGRRERGAPDALVAPLAGWSEPRQELAWWGQTLAALEAPADSRPLSALRRGLRELGVPQAPLQWSLDGDGARDLLRSWQPWRLLSALAGGGLDGPVRGLALAVEAPPEFSGLELRARLSLGA